MNALTCLDGKRNKPIKAPELGQWARHMPLAYKRGFIPDFFEQFQNGYVVVIPPGKIIFHAVLMRILTGDKTGA